MYRVGQVLYVILNKRQQVIPCQVVEQVVRKKLEGQEETSHIVRIPLKREFKEHTLSELDGIPYESIEDVRKVLFENVSMYIEDVTSSAINQASAAFGKEMVGDISRSPASTQDVVSSTDTAVKVTLEDGTIANVNMKLPDAGESA